MVDAETTPVFRKRLGVFPVRFSPNRFPNKHPGKVKGNHVNNSQNVYQQWEDKQRAMGRPTQQPIVPIPEIYCDSPPNAVDRLVGRDKTEGQHE